MPEIFHWLLAPVARLEQPCLGLKRGTWDYTLCFEENISQARGMLLGVRTYISNDLICVSSMLFAFHMKLMLVCYVSVMYFILVIVSIVVMFVKMP